MVLSLAPQPTKFEELVAGSTIRLAHTKGLYEAAEGLVISSVPEAGTFGLPAIDFLETGDTEPRKVFQNGEWIAEVLVDARDAAHALGGNVLPQGGFSALPITTEVTAAEFDGTNAVEIIRWAVGITVISFERSNGLLPDRLLIQHPDGVQIAEPGDLVVQESGRFVRYDVDGFNERFTPLGE